MPDGASLRDHLVAALAAGAPVEDELTPPPIPPGCDELVAMYWQLRRQAGSNGLSPNPVGVRDLLAWQTLYDVRLTPDEIDALFAMDDAALAAFAEHK